MKKVKGMPITGARPQYSKKKPLVPNAADTSKDAQTMIAQAPMPFKDRNSTAQIPTAGSAASGGVSTMEPSILSGMKRTTVTAKALPPRGPVGQRKPINQSGQMNGRMGNKFTKRKGAIPGYFGKRKANASFYGE